MTWIEHPFVYIIWSYPNDPFSGASWLTVCSGGTNSPFVSIDLIFDLFFLVEDSLQCGTPHFASWSLDYIQKYMIHHCEYTIKDILLISDAVKNIKILFRKFFYWIGRCFGTNLIHTFRKCKY